MLTGCSSPIVIQQRLLVPPEELEPYCPELTSVDFNLTENLVDTYVSDLGVYKTCRAGVIEYILWIKNMKATMEKQHGSSR